MFATYNSPTIPWSGLTLKGLLRLRAWPGPFQVPAAQGRKWLHPRDGVTCSWLQREAAQQMVSSSRRLDPVEGENGEIALCSVISGVKEA